MPFQFLDCNPPVLETHAQLCEWKAHLARDFGDNAAISGLREENLKTRHSDNLRCNYPNLKYMLICSWFQQVLHTWLLPPHSLDVGCGFTSQGVAVPIYSTCIDLEAYERPHAGRSTPLRGKLTSSPGCWQSCRCSQRLGNNHVDKQLLILQPPKCPINITCLLRILGAARAMDTPVKTAALKVNSSCLEPRTMFG